MFLLFLTSVYNAGMEDDRDIKDSLARFRKYGRLQEGLGRDDQELPVSGVFFDHDGIEVDPEEVGLNADAFRGRVVNVSDDDE